MPHRRCRKSSAMFLCGVITLFCWQSTIYPVRGQSGADSWKTAAAKVQPLNDSKDEVQQQISVQKGDTLWSLAQKYQMSLKQLTQMNQIKYPDHVRAGQKLWVIKPASRKTDLIPANAKTRNTEIDTTLIPTEEVSLQAPIQASTQNQSQPRSQSLSQQASSVKTYEIFMGEDELDEGQVSRGGNASVASVQAAGQQTFILQPSVQALAPNTVDASRGPQVPEVTAKEQISKADLELLARVIYAEARGEDFKGQIAVGAVVLNRVKDGRFPKTIKDVIYQPGAFTAVVDKQIHLNPDEEAYRAAEAALAGQDPTGGALYYYNPKTATDRWIKSRPVLKQIGNHTFSI